MLDYPIVHIELKVRDCTAEVFLNGIPIKRLVAAEQLFSSLPVLQYLRHPENLVEVVVFPGAEPARDRAPRTIREVSGAEVAARLVSYRDGDFTDAASGHVLGEIFWSGAGSAEAPLVLSTPCAGVATAGPWIWESAPVLSLDRDGPAIAAEISLLHGLFRDGRADDLLARMDDFIQESVLAYPAWGRAEVEGMLRRDIAQNAGRVEWVQDLNPDDFSLRLCADGRLVECIDRNWQPIIRTRPQPDGEIYPFPVFLGRTERGLEILR